MTDPRILERIKKLLALSQSPNPNEAAVALQRAQKLMQEHSLSSTDISLSEINEKGEKVLPALRDRILYFALADIVSKAFGVSNYVRRKHTLNGYVASEIYFIGPNSRLDSACYTFTILSRQALNVKKEFSKNERQRLKTHKIHEIFNLNIMQMIEIETRYNGDFEAYLKKEVERELRKNSKAYLSGWIRKVSEKVNEFALSDEESHLIDLYIDKNHPDMTTMRTGRRAAYTEDQRKAYSNGVRDAEKNVQLYHGINGQASERLGFFKD